MRFGGIALGAAAVVVLATGCGGSGGGDHVAAQPKPTTPRAELLLSASDFPAGFKTEIISPSQSEEPTGTGSDSVTPAACSEDKRNALKDVPDKDVSAITATDESRGLVYGDAVMDTVVDIAKAKDLILVQCPDLTMHESTGDIHLKFTELPLPSGLHAERAFEYTMTSSPSISAGDANLEAIAVVRGMTVSVSAFVMGSAPVDRAVFDKLFVAAVDKVANAK